MDKQGPEFRVERRGAVAILRLMRDELTGFAELLRDDPSATDIMRRFVEGGGQLHEMP